ncbi:MAG TPA: dUTP diphosphatase [Candidatus Cloacimonetes bacterium]|nr:dUTP diphosphatase [Candidatus Cloacimonadota bacterium]
MKISFQKLHDKATLPKRMTQGSSGYDVYACLGEDITLLPMKRMAVPTGFALSIPLGYEAQVRARSGLALNHGICVLNSPGTIDSDYRGEVKVILANLGEEPVQITHGMRIAQLVFSRIEEAEFVEVQSLEESKRSEGGFGHSGY